MHCCGQALHELCVFSLRAALSLPLLGLAVGLSPEPAGILAYPDWVSRGFKVGTLSACSRCNVYLSMRCAM